ncbi:MAG: hypothetical protein ACP5OG_01030 [Candidatus Nanoarchaeia archaeon]
MNPSYNILSEDEIQKELEKYRKMNYKWKLYKKQKNSISVYSPKLKSFLIIDSQQKNLEPRLKNLVFGDKTQLEYLKIMDLCLLLKSKNSIKEFSNSSYIDYNIYINEIKNHKNYADYLKKQKISTFH